MLAVCAIYRVLHNITNLDNLRDTLRKSAYPRLTQLRRSLTEQYILKLPSGYSSYKADTLIPDKPRVHHLRCTVEQTRRHRQVRPSGKADLSADHLCHCAGQ